MSSASDKCEPCWTDAEDPLFMLYTRYQKQVFQMNRTKVIITPLTPNIKGQILLSCPHTFLIKVLGRSY